VTNNSLSFPPKTLSQSFLVVIGGGIAGIIMGASRHILLVVFPHMKSSIEMNYQDLGILTSSYFLSYMVSSYIWGHYSDRIGGKRIVLFGSLLCGAMIIGIGFSSHFFSALFFTIIIGIGAGGIHVPMLSIILKWFADGKRGFAVSMFLVGEGILAILVGITIPLITLMLSWRFVWWFFGMFAILLTFGLLPLIRDYPTVGGAKKPASYLDEERITFFNIMKAPKMTTLSCVYFLQAITRGAFMTFIVTYLINEGISFKIAGGAFSSLGLGFIPGTILSGIASDRFRRTRVLASLLFIESFSLALLLLIQEVIPFYFLLTMVGFCMVGIVTVMTTIPSEYYSPKIYGKTLGFLTFVYGVGVTLSPFVGGTIADLTGSLTITLWIFGTGTSITAGIIALLMK
jgi:MFS family permease